MPEIRLQLVLGCQAGTGNERRRAETLIERLNAAFKTRARIEIVDLEIPVAIEAAADTGPAEHVLQQMSANDLLVCIFGESWHRGVSQGPSLQGFGATPQARETPTARPQPPGRAPHARLTTLAIHVFHQTTPVFYAREQAAAISAQQQVLDQLWRRWTEAPGAQTAFGYQAYNGADDFERKLEATLRQWLARVDIAPEGAVWDRIAHGSPYPGRAPFAAEHEPVFFGRTSDVERMLAKLSRSAYSGTPFLLLSGASGVGKTSVLQAGLLPRLSRPGTIGDIDLSHMAVLTASANPILDLARALLTEAALGVELKSAGYHTPEALADVLGAGEDAAMTAIQLALDRAEQQAARTRGNASARRVRLLLAVDQLERAVASAPAHRLAIFAGLLRSLAKQDLAYVVGIVRSDAMPALRRVPAFDTLLTADRSAQHQLQPPSAGDLEAIVLRPAAACTPALAFETDESGRSLAEHMLEEFSGAPDSAFLQLALHEVYAAEAERGDGVLRFADFSGAAALLCRLADQALSGSDAAAQDELPALLSALVRLPAEDADLGGQPLSAPFDRAKFEVDNPARRELIDAFVAHRLLKLEAFGEQIRVSPAGPALLQAWPIAVALLGSANSALRTRNVLKVLARSWAKACEQDRPAHVDLSPALLADAKALLADGRTDHSQEIEDFIQHAVAAELAARERQAAELAAHADEVAALQAAIRAEAETGRQRLQDSRATHLREVADLNKDFEAERKDHAEELATLAYQKEEHARHVAKIAHEIAGATHDLVATQAHHLRAGTGLPQATFLALLEQSSAIRELTSHLAGTTAEISQAEATALLELTEASISQRHSELAQHFAAQWRDKAGANKDDGEERIGDAWTAAGEFELALAAYQNVAEQLGSAPEYEAPLASASGRSAALSVKIGDCARALGRTAEAFAAYERAAASLHAAINANPLERDQQRRDAQIVTKIGDLARVSGDIDRANSAYQRALSITQQLAAADPHDPVTRRQIDSLREKSSNTLSRLAAAACAEHRFQDGLDLLASAFALREDLARSRPDHTGHAGELARLRQDMAMAHIGAAEASCRCEAFELALVDLGKAEAILTALADTTPEDQRRKRSLAACRERIGTVLIELGDAARKSGDTKSALHAFEKAQAARSGHTGSTGSEPRPETCDSATRRRIAEVLLQSGDNARLAGDAAAALKSYEHALEIRQELVAADPANLAWQAELADCRGNVADVLIRMGEVAQAAGRAAEARTVYQRAAEMRTLRLDLSPSRSDWQHQHDDAMSHIAAAWIAEGEAEQQAGQRQAAKQAFESARTIREQLAASSLSDNRRQDDLDACDTRLAVLLIEIGHEHRERGEFDAAFQNFQLATEIRARLAARAPHDTDRQDDLDEALSLSADTLRTLARHAQHDGRLDEARNAYEQALALQQQRLATDPGRHDLKQEIADTRRAIAETHTESGQAAEQSRDLTAALHSYRSALDIHEHLAKHVPSFDGLQTEQTAARCRVADVLMMLGEQNHEAHRHAEALAAFEEAAVVRKTLLDATKPTVSLPLALAKARMRAGDARIELGRFRDALETFTGVLPLLQNGDAEASDEAAITRTAALVHEKIGDTQIAMARHELALEAYQTAVSELEGTDEAHASQADIINDLMRNRRKIGNVLMELADTASAGGQSEHALAAYAKACAVRMQLVEDTAAPGPELEDLAIVHDRIGDLHLQVGRRTEALGAYRESCSCRSRLLVGTAQDSELCRRLSLSLDKIGDIEMAGGLRDEARASYQRALAIREQFAAIDAGRLDWQRDLSVSHEKIADVLASEGSHSQALESYRIALALRERLLAAQPDHAGRQRDLSVAWERIGNAELALGRRPQSLAAYQTALAARQSLAEAAPFDVGCQHDLMVARAKIGNAQLECGHRSEALGSYHDAHAIAERLAEAFPDDSQHQVELCWSLWRLAGLGVQPVRSFETILATLIRLDQQGRLTTYQASFIAKARRQLRTLTAPQQDVFGFPTNAAMTSRKQRAGTTT